MAAAGSSRFAVTCGLMRQYMREQQQDKRGAMRPPALSLLPPPEETDARTLQLFPTRATGVSQPSQERPEAKTTTAPLTIFYDGRALVFQDFPADKAKEIIQLAASASLPVVKVALNPAEPPATQSAELFNLPMSRKASLQRFLEKRKHRNTTSDPYQKVTASPADRDAGVKPVKDIPASWLSL